MNTFLDSYSATDKLEVTVGDETKEMDQLNDYVASFSTDEGGTEFADRVLARRRGRQRARIGRDPARASTRW